MDTVNKDRTSRKVPKDKDGASLRHRSKYPIMLPTARNHIKIGSTVEDVNLILIKMTESNQQSNISLIPASGIHVMIQDQLVWIP